MGPSCGLLRCGRANRRILLAIDPESGVALSSCITRMQSTQIVSVDTGITQELQLEYRPLDAIKTAFGPLVGGSRGKIWFDGEDTFVETESGKVLTSWRLTLETDESKSIIRDLDSQEFNGNKLTKKMAYMKVDKPRLKTN